MRKLITFITVGILAAFGAGYWLGHMPGGPDGGGSAAAAASDEIKFWTCSMHPQIKQPGPGKCPLCGMDLVPVKKGSSDGLGLRQLALSESAIKRAEIRTVPVERRYASAEIRLVGKLEYDETKVAYITSWVPGRLDRLYVDYTGVMVKSNDHMIYLYSPELMTAQEELLSAIETARRIEQSTSSIIKERVEATVHASREKLRLWGLTAEQVREIESRGTASDHLTIRSPISGVVVHKNGLEGMYVDTGTRIYTIADLSHLWLKLDAYESDLPWLHYGQEVQFETEAYPGEVFNGIISFIDPVLNDRTRTVKVRVNVPNPGGKLKPEMFVRAVVRSKLAKGGKIMDLDLAGKWISPMHPEIVKDHPGSCDVCGMDLVSAESLGYVSEEAGKESAPLMIPSSAPLITGQRAVVYVAVTNQPGVFEGREIVLGPRAGNHYIVKEGLEEGELVVTHGNFKIDSAIQIMAKPSMMDSQAGGGMPGHDHGAEPHPGAGVQAPIVKMPAPEAFQAQLAGLISPYSRVVDAMRTNSPPDKDIAIGTFLEHLKEVDMTLLEGDAHVAWMREMEHLRNAAAAMKGKAVPESRASLAELSKHLLWVGKTFGLGEAASMYVMECPMALSSRGAIWLQKDKDLKNPYFSGGMLTCGTVLEVLSSPPADSNEDTNRAEQPSPDQGSTEEPPPHEPEPEGDGAGSQPPGGELSHAPREAAEVRLASGHKQSIPFPRS